MSDAELRIDGWLTDLAQTLTDARVLVERGFGAFESDLALPLAFEAICNRVGELCKKLSAADAQRFTDAIWSQAARNRDFVVHQYHRVDTGVLWMTVTRDFPRLEKLVDKQRRSAL